MKETANEINNELLKLAKRRVFLKRTIKWHAIIFLIINVVISGIFHLFGVLFRSIHINNLAGGLL